MSSIPGKALSPKYVNKKPDKNTFPGSQVVGIRFSVSPISLIPEVPFAIKVLAIKANGSTQDITLYSSLVIGNPGLVQLYSSGLLIANTTGLTTLNATFQKFEISAPVIILGTSDWTYFRWTMTENSSDFIVTLPEPESHDLYMVLAQIVNTTDLVGIYLPDVAPGDRTIDNFRVITTSNLSIGDQIDFLIIE